MILQEILVSKCVLDIFGCQKSRDVMLTHGWNVQQRGTQLQMVKKDGSPCLVYVSYVSSMVSGFKRFDIRSPQ